MGETLQATGPTAVAAGDAIGVPGVLGAAGPFVNPGPAASVGLRGRPLRRAAMAVLLRAGRPLSIGQVLVAIEALGVPVGTAYPRKAVADALAREHGRGWAIRVARGVYGVGTISPSSRWRLLNGPGSRRASADAGPATSSVGRSGGGGEEPFA